MNKARPSVLARYALSTQLKKYVIQVSSADMASWDRPQLKMSVKFWNTSWYFLLQSLELCKREVRKTVLIAPVSTNFGSSPTLPARRGNQAVQFKVLLGNTESPGRTQVRCSCDCTLRIAARLPSKPGPACDTLRRMCLGRNPTRDLQPEAYSYSLLHHTAQARGSERVVR